MHTFNHAISWFEIPVANLERATAFYETIFHTKLMPIEMPNIRMRLFPLQDEVQGVGGALVDSGGFHRPSMTDGPLIYLNGNPDLQEVLNRITAAGGTILVPKAQISDSHGFMAVFFDSEGNRVGLHSVG